MAVEVDQDFLDLAVDLRADVDGDQGLQRARGGYALNDGARGHRGRVIGVDLILGLEQEPPADPGDNDDGGDDHEGWREPAFRARRGGRTHRKRGSGDF